MWKIWPCEVCEFCILLYYARKSVIRIRNVITLFLHNTKVYKIRKTHRTILYTFYNTVQQNFIKFRMFFSAVLMNIPNLKVCLKGESSIVVSKTTSMSLKLDTVYLNSVHDVTIDLFATRLFLPFWSM